MSEDSFHLNSIAASLKRIADYLTRNPPIAHMARAEERMTVRPHHWEIRGDDNKLARRLTCKDCGVPIDYVATDRVPICCYGTPEAVTWWRDATAALIEKRTATAPTVEPAPYEPPEGFTIIKQEGAVYDDGGRIIRHP